MKLVGRGVSWLLTQIGFIVGNARLRMCKRERNKGTDCSWFSKTGRV